MFGMFKNAAVQVKLVNTKEQNVDDTTTDIITMDPEQIAKIATDTIVKTVVVIGIAIAAHTVLTTVCDIALEATKAKLK